MCGVYASGGVWFFVLGKERDSLQAMRGRRCAKMYGGVAELVDAPDSKSGDSNVLRVRVSPPLPSLTLVRMAIIRR